MKRLYKNCNCVFENEIKAAEVLCENGKIISVSENITVPADEIIDCGGRFLSPGFCDLHVHGGGGFSAMSSDPSDIIKMCAAHAKYGTTSIVPTTLAAPLGKLKKAIESISEAKKRCTESNILGVHLEGPFISQKMRGAQSPSDILVPDRESVSKLLDSSDDILIIGAAPEIENGFTVGEEAEKRGIVASAAHSDASYETAVEALKHGFCDVTHIYSACSSMHKEGIFRKVGLVEAGLTEDGYTCQFIADLRHLPVGAVRLIYKAKGADRAYAITDGLEFSAMDIPEGTRITQKNGLEVIKENGVMLMGDKSCLAGSCATADALVRNLYRECLIPLTDCVKMASLTPLKVVGMDKLKGRICPGFDEDLVVFDEKISVSFVCVKGNAVKNEL